MRNHDAGFREQDEQDERDRAAAEAPSACVDCGRDCEEPPTLVLGEPRCEWCAPLACVICAGCGAVCPASAYHTATDGFRCDGCALRLAQATLARLAHAEVA